MGRSVRAAGRTFRSTEPAVRSLNPGTGDASTLAATLRGNTLALRAGMKAVNTIAGFHSDSITPPRAAVAARKLAAIDATATVLRGRWRPMVLWLLASGCRRFSQLTARLPGISPKVLTQQLRALDRAGLITRHPSPGGRRVEYQLTELGESLRPVLQELERWGANHLLPGSY